MTAPHLEVEHGLVSRGYEVVIGVDEVGRGALAGPVWVTAGAWTMTCSGIPEGLRDSKLITPAKRPVVADRAKEWLLGFASGHVDAASIDRHGIMWALGHAGATAVMALWNQLGRPRATAVVLDGNHDWLSPQLDGDFPVMTQIKADVSVATVAAASVIAKVGRDAVMVEADQTYPGYGFGAHKGYGSPAHRAALIATGPTAIHRVSWLGSILPSTSAPVD